MIPLAEAGLRIAIGSSLHHRHILAAPDKLRLADHVTTVVPGSDLQRG